MPGNAPPSDPAPAGAASGAYVYEGGELALFERAVHWKAYFAARLRAHVRGDVLEVGAGIGGTTRCVCDGTQASWCALEPDARMADEMRRKLAEQPLPVPAEVASCALADLPAERRFDTILYMDVLEHIAGDREEAQRAFARLRPGGCLVILAPAHQWLYTEFDRAIGHHRRYDARALRAIAPAGSEEVCMRYLDSVGLLASLGNRLFLRSAMPTPQQLRFWDSCLVPLSRVVDPLLGYRAGKSVFAVWRRPASAG
jgi:SAM-dependent methyltransferase